MTSILITGFEPFNEWKVNSSWEAARIAADLLGSNCRAVLLPVDHAAAHERIADLFAGGHPDVCLLTELAAGEGLRLERSARKPAELADVPGPEMLAGSWAWENAAAKLADSGFPVSLSDDAGAFVCESTYWSALNRRRSAGAAFPIAFLHVPPLSDLWSAARIAEAMRIVLAAL